jgi:hypothetical protein
VLRGWSCAVAIFPFGGLGPAQSPPSQDDGDIQVHQHCPGPMQPGVKMAEAPRRRYIASAMQNNNLHVLMNRWQCMHDGASNRPRSAQHSIQVLDVK